MRQWPKNSSPTRRAIHLYDTTIRICSVPRLTRKNRFIKISSWDKVVDKVMSLAEYFCRPFFVWIFQIWPYPRHNPMVAASGVGMAGLPMRAQA